MGPIKVGNQKYYILTMIDEFRKYMWMRAHRVMNSEKVIKLLEDIVTHFPRLKRFLTDQAGYFTSLELSAWCEDQGIKLDHSIPWTPSTNG